MSSDWQHLAQQVTSDSATDNHQSIMTPLRWSVLAIEGADAKSFLQGQVTLNLDNLSPGKVAYGGYCNLKGRLHALFYLAQVTPTLYWMILPNENAQHALTTLKKYALFSKVTLTSTMDSPCLGLIKPNHEALDVQFFTLKAVSIKGHELTALALSHDRVMLIGDDQALMATWQSLAPSTQPVNACAWDCYDIRDGRPFLSAQTLEFFLPHYVGLIELGGVDFSKGCYLGQEIIARMEYRGNIKRHRMYAKTQAQHLPQPGSAICLAHSDKEVGHVIASSQHHENIELLITLQQDAQEQELELNLPEKPALKAVVTYSEDSVQPN